MDWGAVCTALVLIVLLGPDPGHGQGQGGPIMISESDKAEKQLHNISCSSGVPTFTTLGIAASFFRVDNSSRGSYVLVLNASIDVDDDNFSGFSPTITITCPGQGSDEIHIQILPVNDYPPYFCSANSIENVNNHSTYVSESARVGYLVYRAHVCDRDRVDTPVTPRFTIKGAKSMLKWKSSGMQFDVTLAQPLDYDTEIQHDYTFMLTVTDEDGRNASMQLVMQVTDFDNQGPAFTQTHYNCSFPEGDYTHNSTACRLLAYDRDTGINATILYRLVSSFPSTRVFSVAEDGHIWVSGDLNRETTASYTLSIMGYEAGREADRSDSTIVTMHVTDMDDNPPVLTSLAYSVSVPENTQNGSLILQLTATDTDEGVNAQYQFRLRDPSGAFHMNETTGRLTVGDDRKLDRETQAVFNMTADAVGVRHPEMMSQLATITISLLDRNDNAPVFLNVSACSVIGGMLTLQVNKTDTGEICKVNASDADSGPNKDIKFRLVSQGATPPFGIGEASGSLYISGAVAVRTYTFTVVAQDQALEEWQRRSTSLAVMVAVLDVNMNTPQFTADTADRKVNISEGATLGTILMQVMATDADPTDQVILSIVAGNLNNTFRLQPGRVTAATTAMATNSSFIQLARSLDREVVDQYDLTLEVTDTEHTNHTHVYISVLDVNDNAPIFTETTYNFNHTEEDPVDTRVGVVKATDLDIGDNGVVVYSLDDQYNQWQANFTINETSGEIETRAGLDREALGAGDVITMVVVAHDRGVPRRNSWAEVRVAVGDVNDNGPRFAHRRVSYSIAEDSTLSYAVGQVTDADIGENRECLFHLLEGNCSLFHVNVTTGELTTTRGVGFADTKVNNTLDIVIEAYNAVPYKGLASNDTQTVAITVMDTNNHWPLFKESNVYSKTIRENMHISDHRPRICLLRIEAEDADETPEYSTVTYWLDGGQPYFEINSTTGDLYLVHNVNYDPPASQTQFKFNVVASDMMPNVNGTVIRVTHEVTINVTNVNDNQPMFDQAVYTCYVKENYTGPLDNCTVSALDQDAGPPGDITYSVNNTKLFNISATGQLRLLSQQDYEEDQHTQALTVTAADHGTPTRRAQCKVVVHVENVNDNKPDFTRAPYNFSIYENNAINKTIGRVMVYDTDGDPLTVSINDSYTALLYLSLYMVIGNGGLGGRVLETAYSNLHAIAVFQMFKYRRMPMGGWEDFLMSRDGILYASVVFDVETMFPNVTVVVPVTVSDGDPSHDQTTDVTINILPVNEHSPKFEHDTYDFSVDENASKQFSFVATDGDVGEDGHVTYACTGDDQWPGNMTCLPNGTLFVTALDREVLGDSGTITLTVVARDGGDPARTGLATITLTVHGVNDNAPVYPPDTRNLAFTLTEGQRHPNFFTSHATDRDIGPGSKVIYRLVNATSDADAFKVRPAGEVSMTRPLWISDANNGVVVLTIEAFNNATYTGPSPASAIQIVTIALKDVNNHAPVYQDTPYSKKLSECTKPGTSIFRVHATDGDRSAAYNTVTYWLGVGANDDRVYIDSHTGELYLTAPVDYDPPNSTHSLTVTVYAADERDLTTTGNHTVSTVITLNITDCNDNPPTFTHSRYRCPVDEDYSGPIPGCVVSATDRDAISTVTYNLVDDSQALFTVNGTGHIGLRFPQDYDAVGANHSFTIHVTASDREFTSTATVLVSLTNLNDEAPMFDNSIYDFTLYENTDVHEAVLGQIHATDPDGGHIYLTLDDQDFNISKDGLLTANREFDRETHTEPIKFQAVANDTVHTATTIITVTILDRNEYAPQFTDAPYKKQIIPENITEHSLILSITATDGDSNNVTYAILEGNEGQMFYLDSDIIMTNGTFNASLSQQYRLVIQATDDGTPQLLSITTLTVDIEDVNDNAPYFLYTPYTAHMVENHDGPVIQVHARDPDPSSKLKYFVNDPQLQPYFTFEGDFLHAKLLDADNSTIGVNVSVCIRVTDGVHNVTAVVAVSVADLNDNTPYFVNEPYVANVPDTSPTGTDVLNVTAGDDDVTNAGFTYILYESGGDFAIDSTSGRVTVAGVLVHGTPAYRLTVTVIDSGTPPNTNTTLVNITIGETNHDAPSFPNSSYVFLFPENNQSVCVRVAASDGDAGQAGDVTYSLAPGGDAAMFHIDNTTGTITLAHPPPLDYEASTQYQISVIAMDHAEYPKSSTANVIIQVTNVNEGPSFSTVSSPKYKELNSSVGTEVAQVHASDPDDGDNVTYSLQHPGTPYFTVDQVTGTITVQRRLDTAGNFSLTVVATDGSGLSANVSLSVHVSNVTGKNIHINIIENGTAHEIDNLQAQLNSTNLTFKLMNGTGTDMFSLTPHGELSVTGPLDMEANVTVYDLDINGYNSINHNLQAQIQYHVSVTDVNDNPPKFNQSEYQMDVREESPTGTSVGQVTATDADTDAVQTLVYSIVDPSSVFRINNMTGDITVRARIDYDDNYPRKRRFVLHIECSDGLYNATTTVYVRVTDINDQAPHFVHHLYSFNVSETNSTGPVTVAMVMALDTDTADIGHLTYSIVAGDGAGYFGMNPDTGQLTIERPIDFENINSTVFNITVTVTDTAKHSDTAYMDISIIDVNDNPPVFGQNSYEFSILEGMTNTSQPMEVAASDEDSGYNADLTFSIVPDSSLFTIETAHNKGIIHVVAPLDREGATVQHTANGSAVNYLTVNVRDHGRPQLSASTQVVVYIVDVNDHQPQFVESKSVYSVPENTDWPGVIDAGAVDADCGDNARLTYTLYNYTDIFHVNVTTGHIHLATPLDRETQAHYILTVQVADGGTPSLTNHRKITVNVLDVNDNSPVFHDTITDIHLQENTTGEVFRVFANDSDSGQNGAVTYRLTNTDPVPFDVDLYSGAVSVHHRLDYETQSRYSLLVEARDGGHPPLTTVRNVTVYVTDVHDSRPTFSQAVYRTTLDVGADVNTVIYGVSAGDGMTYSLTGEDAEYFSIDETSGEICVIRRVSDIRTQFLLSVSATDGRGHRATCQVIVELDGHAVLFSGDGSYTAQVLENLPVGNETLLLDLNTTEEATGHVTYTIDSIVPTVAAGVFHVDAPTGRVYCQAPLDREEEASYHITISAQSNTTRRHKRASQSTTVRLVVRVGDVNDNPPVFPPSRNMVGVPSTAKANYLLTSLQATDADAGANGAIIYTTVGGDMDVFGVDGDTGDVRTLVALASREKRHFHLVVTATDGDGDGFNTSTSLQIVVVQVADRLVLTAHIPHRDYLQQESQLISNMSTILGVYVGVETSATHIDNSGYVDLDTTDIYFHGLNMTTSAVVPYDVMTGLIRNHEDQLKHLFGQRLVEVTRVPVDKDRDPADITVAQIALICLAIFIFFGTLVGIILAQVSWRRMERAVAVQRGPHKLPTSSSLEMDTFHSRRASQLSTTPTSPPSTVAGPSSTIAGPSSPPALTFTNAAFVERDAGESSSDDPVAQEGRGPVEYEVQKRRLQFPTEAPPADYNNDVHGADPLNASFSAGDSGVDNASLPSDDPANSRGQRDTEFGPAPGLHRDAGLQGDKPPVVRLSSGEGPVMTSSPRVSQGPPTADNGHSEPARQRQDSTVQASLNTPDHTAGVTAAVETDSGGVNVAGRQTAPPIAGRGGGPAIVLDETTTVTVPGGEGGAGHQANGEVAITAF